MQPSEWEIPMATKRTAAPNKENEDSQLGRVRPCPQRHLLQRNRVPQRCCQSWLSSFNPHLLLTKLSAGKTSQEYLAEESVFSQGDAADAVFYIQSGKVKLTVVSKSGKEAVVAILPQASFFGEGCLAGQPLRMATASAVERSTIVRVKSVQWSHCFIRNRSLLNTFLPIFFPGISAWKLTS